MGNRILNDEGITVGHFTESGDGMVMRTLTFDSLDKSHIMEYRCNATITFRPPTADNYENYNDEEYNDTNTSSHSTSDVYKLVKLLFSCTSIWVCCRIQLLVVHYANMP